MLTNTQYSNPVHPSGNDWFEFYPKINTVGQIVLKINVIGSQSNWWSGEVADDDFIETGFLSGYEVGLVFGLPDSIRRVTVGNTVLRWSKNFGILGLPGFMPDLVGIQDISLGLKDYDSHGLPTLTSLNDTIHFCRIYENRMVWPSLHLVQDVRTSIMEYPYQGDMQRAKYRVVYSDPGSTYGVEMHEVLYCSSESVHALGTFNETWPKDYNAGWLGDDGLYIRINIRPSYMDGMPKYTISTCGQNPFLGFDGQIASSGGGTKFLRFPYYITGQNQCTSGIALHPVTITASKRLVQEEQVTLYPNPGRSRISFSGRTGILTMFDRKGRQVLHTDLRQIPEPDISLLSSGMYNFTILSESGNVATGKWVKE